MLHISSSPLINRNFLKQTTKISQFQKCFSAKIPKTRLDIENIPLTKSNKAPGKGSSSLVASSLFAMEHDQEYKVTTELLHTLGRQHMTSEEQKKQRRG